jgi:PAS domain S-box-containing protein
LYVDDDELARRAMNHIFRRAGFRFREAATGREALQIAQEKPDLVLLDVQLPDINGFEVCRRIKSHPATRAIPVLHLSAMYVSSQDRTHGLEGGADGYLTKPVETNELIAQVNAILRIHRAEEETRRVARQWQATFDAISDGICLLDEHGRIQRCNQALARIVARPTEELVDRCWDELSAAHPMIPATPFQRVLETLRRETAALTVRERSFRATADPILDEGGRLLGAVCILADVTEQKRLEEQLRQAQKMQAVGQLAGGVAHDFNNLLTVILGNVSLLLEYAGDLNPPAVAGDKAGGSSPPTSRPNVRATLQTIEKAGLHAADLVRQLLGFARQTILWLQPLNLHRAVAETVPILQRTIDPRITVDVSTTDDLWAVQADPGQIKQVVMNLCLNARDAMPEGGELVLETANIDLDIQAAVRHVEARPGQFVRLRVSDTGHGMPPGVQARIFEPFFTTKDPDKGIGLGLAMVFGIVKQHQGWIECSSTPGQGTTLDIYLPRCAEAALTVDEAPTGPQSAYTGRETILLVDDEEMIRDLGRATLESAGYRVLLAADGGQAVDVYLREQQRIDLVILDLTMPQLSGRDTLRRLLAINPNARILLSSGFSAEDSHPAPVEGALGFIPKPYRRPELLGTVRTALDASKYA